MSIQKTWAEMDLAERTQYLTPMIGYTIEVAYRKDVEVGRDTFGAAFAPPYSERVLLRLRPSGEQHEPSIEVKGYTGPFGMPVTGVTPFDDIYDVRLKPEPADDPEYSELLRLRQLQRDVAAFVEARKDAPATQTTWLDICAQLQGILDKASDD